MARNSKNHREELAELVGQRPGWRLEPQATPGATPLWCYVDEGRIEFSVSTQGDLIRLYEMATDEEITFDDAEALTSWLRVHRSDALRDPPSRARGKARFRSFFEWS